MSETVEVDVALSGDFVLHYHGLGVGPVENGDYVTALSADVAEPGQLVVIPDGDGTGGLAEYVPGMAIHGRVTGLMRRLA